MKATYDEATSLIFADEGGYTNDPNDTGGPTNWGITLADARLYWKANATAADVRAMPKSVAIGIYRKHYADPVRYDDLPAGVDYAVLDFAINSGNERAIRFLQKVVGIIPDGTIGKVTLDYTAKMDPKEVINQLYDARMAFLRTLVAWPTFGRGWTARCNRGRKAALVMVDKYPSKPKVTTVPIAGGAVAAGVAVSAASAPHHYVPYVLLGAAIIAAFSYLYHRFHKTNVAINNKAVVKSSVV